MSPALEQVENFVTVRRSMPLEPGYWAARYKGRQDIGESQVSSWNELRT
jgi:hypothetical protein